LRQIAYCPLTLFGGQRKVNFNGVILPRNPVKYDAGIAMAAKALR
jgi:hypothetical protein